MAARRALLRPPLIVGLARTIQYAAAYRFIRLWNTGSPLSRAMTWRVWRALSAVIASETKQSMQRQERMDCFVARAPRNDGETQRHTSAFSRRAAPEVCMNLRPEIRGRGECRAPTHPQPRVQSRKHTTVVTTRSPVKPGIPARGGLRLT